MTEAAAATKTVVTETEAGTKSIKMAPSAVAGDWINRIFAEHARVVTQEAVAAVAAVEAVAETVDADGNVLEAGVEAVPAVRAVAEKSALDEDKINELAAMNGLTLKESYPNIGMRRMALSNKMRAAAKRRGGLMLPGKDGDAVWTDSPADFEIGDVTENHEGHKIVKQKAGTAENADAAEAEGEADE